MTEVEFLREELEKRQHQAAVARDLVMCEHLTPAMGSELFGRLQDIMKPISEWDGEKETDWKEVTYNLASMLQNLWKETYPDGPELDAIVRMAKAMVDFDAGKWQEMGEWISELTRKELNHGTDTAAEGEVDSDVLEDGNSP